MNDNVSVNLASFPNTVAEDSSTDTTVSIMSVKDPDSGKNGLISCIISPSLHFKMKSTLANYYTLVSDGPLEHKTPLVSPGYSVYPTRYADTFSTGTLHHACNYEVYSTTDSRRSEFARPSSQDVLIVNPSSTGTVQRAPSEKKTSLMNRTGG